jgi:hypothetical protein
LIDRWIRTDPIHPSNDDDDGGLIPAYIDSWIDPIQSSISWALTAAAAAAAMMMMMMMMMMMPASID